jgi:integrase/recombinase XerD
MRRSHGGCPWCWVPMKVVRFLEVLPSLKARAALTTAHAAGLRASQAENLKVANIDSSRT